MFCDIRDLVDIVPNFEVQTDLLQQLEGPRTAFKDIERQGAGQDYTASIRHAFKDVFDFVEVIQGKIETNKDKFTADQYNTAKASIKFIEGFIRDIFSVTFSFVNAKMGDTMKGNVDRQIKSYYVDAPQVAKEFKLRRLSKT